MRTAVLILCIFIMASECEINSPEQIDGYAFVILHSDVSNINQANFRIRDKRRYKIQLQLEKDSDMELGNKIYNTYIDVDDTVFQLYNLLSSLFFVFNNDRGEKYIVNHNTLISENTSIGELYGKITVTEKYVFITVAWFELGKGNYHFIKNYLDERLYKYNSSIIIGVGHGGLF